MPKVTEPEASEGQEAREGKEPVTRAQGPGENKEQTARKLLGNLRTQEANRSKETKQFCERGARRQKKLDNFVKQEPIAQTDIERLGPHHSKATKGFEEKEQTLESLRTKDKPSERD